MGARSVAALLVVLLAVIHGQLWLGRGSVPNVSRMQQRIDAQLQSNAQARQRNEQLESEVRDLREGLEMVEEKARAELGMVRPNEIYVQISR